MPLTGSPPHRPRVPGHRFGLAGAAAWSHRWGALAWVAGAGGFLVYFGVAYDASVRTFNGGAASFGLAAAAVAEAMRPLSGAAERLDTYGGYVTYHNASIAALLLSLWAVIQGAGAIRGWEERGCMELWLATGRRRLQVAIALWMGFLVALTVIAIGIGAGFGAGTAVAEEPNWRGAAIVAIEMALVAAGFFAVGMFVSQLTRTARGGAGLTTIGMLALYLTANMAPELGWFGWIRFLSPFFYFQQSGALVPGHSLDPAATAVLVLWVAVPLALAAAAFERRAVGERLWEPRTQAAETRAKSARISAPWLRDTWLADLRSQWLSLTLWALGSALIAVLVVSVAKQVASVWESSEIIRRLFVRIPGTTFIDQYMTYVTILFALAPVSFVVAEASRWVGDLSERRSEAMLAVSGSRSRLVLEWAASAVAGIIVLTLAVLGGCVVGAAAAGLELRPESLLRTGADAILLGTGICGVALLAVVVFRNGLAVGALGAVLGLGFIASLLAPMFNWPEWVVRLSPFEAFGTPYSSVPEPSGMALLAGLAVIGTMTAAMVAQRRSSLT